MFVVWCCVRLVVIILDLFVYFSVLFYCVVVLGNSDVCCGGGVRCVCRVVGLFNVCCG